MVNLLVYRSVSKIPTHHVERVRFGARFPEVSRNAHLSGWYSRNLFLRFLVVFFFLFSSSLRVGVCCCVFNGSGQTIATSHDLTPNGGLVREFPLFQGNLGW